MWNKLFLVLLFLVAFSQSLSAATTSSITQHGITWTFSTEVEYGQFINGDYWIIDSGSGVSVTGISPGYQYTTDPSYNLQPRHINGSMLNNSNKPQGFDSQRNYDGTKNIGVGISAETPLVLVNGDSLLSSISNPDAGETVYQSYTEVVAVLTVVGSDIPSGTFRPSWTGSKVFYNWSSVNLGVLSNIEYAGKPSAANYIDWTTEPVTYFTGWETRFITPMSLSNNYYWSNEVVVPLALMLNLDYTASEKEQMAINMIQIGIDFYGHIRNGERFSPEAGVNLGYKLPVVYAAVLLNATDMLESLSRSGEYRFKDGYTTGTIAPSDMVYFSEDSTFYVDQAIIDRTNDPSWIGYCERANKACVDVPYSQDMLGMPEWASLGFYGFNSCTSSWTETYRTIKNGGGEAFPGISMAVRLIDGGITAFNNSAFLSYVDRYMAIAGGNSDPYEYTVHGEVAASRPGGLIGYLYDTYRMDYLPYPYYPDVVEPTCSDLTQNGDEEGVDCGGSCPNPCSTPTGLRKGKFKVGGKIIKFVEAE